MHNREMRPDSPADSSDNAGLPRALGDNPGERLCLACRQAFYSEGWHNRLCGHCRKRSEPPGYANRMRRA